ncbi:Glutathione S-transferase (GST), C-terminal [Glarea lozoyensis ATCC 20868]|uniref:Glutathione S-transferase (GST), C-terminal n=2 Tax=Glarea lozoyensis TaxID=101852 RepID=S3DD96_GLAL2|nr:Glutathione S-transferase (GST), C-terminal [Glarea lozoyensis ATCC 20868]EHL02127.1 putative Glutathione S-transferase 1 [Glarea lozoyensis 74030]EPE24648.1 Glutathione S-transferase (GST), C-terminal [Glarea lozoyensis ATCC 20868]
MSTEIKPIKMWGKAGPNPSKVHIILLELGIPHELIDVPFSDVKSPEYVKVNPNGRLPTIHDPNTNITLWESGAIIEYLIERYDTKHTLSFLAGTLEYYHAKQWLFYQVTGQGPYFGQAVWFKIYHHEQLESAKERYNQEVNRVTGVLDSYLAQQKEKYSGVEGFDGPWLVGNKASYADIAFVTYQTILAFLLGKDAFDMDKYPHAQDWLARVSARPAVKEGLAAMIAEAGKK